VSWSASSQKKKKKGQGKGALLAPSLLGEPLKCDINVDLVLGRDRIARDLATCNLFQVPVGCDSFNKKKKKQ